jgi:UDP-N-acetyl-D-glucosamine dehydrogenase
MAYKADIDDLRESPGLEIYRMLRQKGCWVEFHDPHAQSFVSLLGNTVESTKLTPGVLETFDASLLVTDHKAFDYKRMAQEAPLILDCRNAFGKRGIHGPNVVKL